MLFRKEFCKTIFPNKYSPGEGYFYFKSSKLLSYESINMLNEIEYNQIFINLSTGIRIKVFLSLNIRILDIKEYSVSYSQ